MKKKKMLFIISVIVALNFLVILLCLLIIFLTPFGVYNARELFGCLCADSKAVLIVSPDHYWHIYCYCSDHHNNDVEHTECFSGTWEKKGNYYDFKFDVPYETSLCKVRICWGGLKWYLESDTQTIEKESTTAFFFQKIGIMIDN